MLIKPLDAVLTEFTNDAIHLVNPAVSIDLTANLWFSIVSVIVLTFVITFITQRVIEPRLGKYVPANAGDLSGTPNSVEDSATGRRIARAQIRRVRPGGCPHLIRSPDASRAARPCAIRRPAR